MRIPSLAEWNANVMQSSDQTLWLLISATLLVLTVPGVALFYGGMVRKKNVLNTIALPFVALALVSVEWGLFGDGLRLAATQAVPPVVRQVRNRCCSSITG